MSTEVRRIRPDEALVLKVTRLAALSDRPDAFGSTFEREQAFTDDVWASRALQSSSGPEAATFVAWCSEAAVGIVGGFRSGAVVDLVSMWTSPDHRRAGIGRQLVEAVVAWSTRGGAERVELWVTRGNDAAQRLYESLGFVVTGDHQPLPSDPCKDELRMTLTIETG